MDFHILIAQVACVLLPWQCRLLAVCFSLESISVCCVIQGEMRKEGLGQDKCMRGRTDCGLLVFLGHFQSVIKLLSGNRRQILSPSSAIFVCTLLLRPLQISLDSLSKRKIVQNAISPSFDHIMIVLVHLISGNMFKYQT